MLVKWLLIFVAMSLTDVVWAFYTRYLADNRPVLAANFAVGITLLGGVTILQYTQDPWMLIPAAAGAWWGTWITVRYNRKGAPTKQSP